MPRLLKSRLRTPYLAAAFVVALSAVPSTALAFKYLTCSPGGYVDVWARNSHPRMYRDECSMPDYTTYTYAYNSENLRWWYVNPLVDYNYVYYSNCTWTQGDGISEVARVSRSSISGDNGLTLWTIAWNNFCLLSGNTIEEADILLADDADYGIEDETCMNWSDPQPQLHQGRVVLAHEMGHFLGLQHDDNPKLLNIMRTYTPYPISGGQGEHAQPFPDDANGFAHDYIGTPIQTNLFATVDCQSCVYGKNGIYPSSYGVSCYYGPGCSYPVTYNFGNNGKTSPGNVQFRIFINPPGQYTGGTNIYVGQVNLPAYTVTTGTVYVATPANLPRGSYWVLFEIDSGHIVSEYDENDNVVTSGSMLTII